MQLWGVFDNLKVDSKMKEFEVLSAIVSASSDFAFKSKSDKWLCVYTSNKNPL